MDYFINFSLQTVGLQSIISSIYLFIYLFNINAIDI